MGPVMETLIAFQMHSFRVVRSGEEIGWIVIMGQIWESLMLKLIV